MAGGSTVGNVAGYIIDLITRGMGATEGLREFRDAGGGIRTQTWYRAFGEVEAGLANRSLIGSADMDHLPGDDLFTDWSAGRSGARAYQVEILVRDRASNTVYTSSYTYITDDLVSGQVAVDAALGDYEDFAEEYDQQIIGASVTGLFRMTGGR